MLCCSSSSACEADLQMACPSMFRLFLDSSATLGVLGSSQLKTLYLKSESSQSLLEPRIQVVFQRELIVQNFQHQQGLQLRWSSSWSVSFWDPSRPFRSDHATTELLFSVFMFNIKSVKLLPLIEPSRQQNASPSHELSRLLHTERLYFS